MKRLLRSNSDRCKICMLCLAVLALALVVSGCSRTPKLTQLDPADVIVAFGDSLTYGTGAAENESYPAVLAQLTGRQVVRSGVPGEVTAQALRRLPGVIAEYQPRLMIVCLGGNDMLGKVNDAEIRSNLRAIIGAIRERGIAVALIGVPRPALLASPPEFYGELAREFAIPYERGIVKDVLYSAGMKSDAIHPNAQGYRRIAEAIAELLHKAGAI
jgi:lysophospholipase L1-like esterase